METKNKDVALYSKRKGDTVFYRKKDYGKDEITETLTVTKITPEFIYAKGKYNTKYKFEINTGNEIKDYVIDGHVYSSENYYKTYLKICYLKSELSSRVDSCYDYFLLLKIKELLDNNVPNNEIIEML